MEPLRIARQLRTPSSFRFLTHSALKLVFPTILLFFLLPDSISCDRTKAKIYIDLKNARGCFRRMNADGVVGCQSSFNGDVGVVHFVRDKNSADLDFVLSKGSTPPYVAVLNPVDFTRNNAMKLIESHESGRVNGVVVLGSADAVHSSDAEGFSPDAACPNRKFGLYADEDECHEWNAAGSGLALEKFPFPVFLVNNDTELSILKDKCFAAFNDPTIAKNSPEVTYPLCGIELHSFMYGSVNSKRCLRRSTKTDISSATYDQQCDPLGDRNVFGFLRDPRLPRPSPSSVVMVAARLDATGFFEEVYPGADSPASGIVALLATAHTLKKVRDKIEAASKNVLFSLFGGESFDYLGSNRAVYDMTSYSSSHWPVSNSSANFTPVELDHFSHFVELSQFSAANGASAASLGAAYLFADKSASGAEATDKMVKTILDVGGAIADLNVTRGGVETLPPASLQQFLKAAKKKGVELPGVVVTEHQDHFANKFYNSFLDTSAKIENRENLVANLGRIATLTARSVLQLATGSDDDKLEVDAKIVDDLVQCFIYDTNCTLFKQVLGDSYNVNNINNKKYQFSYYVGVLRTINNYRLMSQNVLAYFIGDVDDSVAKVNCTGDLFKWMFLGGNGSCVRSFVGDTVASSPAISNLDATNVLFSFDDEKANASAVWTESVWSTNTLTARIFLIPSTKRQVTVLILGILEFLFFMALMFFVSKRSDILFNDDVDSSTEQVLTEAAG